MAITLDQIVAATRVSVANRKRVVSRHELEQRAASRRPRGFRGALARAAASGPAIIAELKKASPSKGLIRASFDPNSIAQQYAAAGAAALSVLTEEEFFLGSLANLCTVSATVELPCLRKDFIVDEFQVLEARAHGADAVLLLASVLPPEELVLLYRIARSLELDVLCEVHDEAELQRAVAAGCDVIGVNNRDLRTFHVDLQTAVRLGPQIPPGIFKVAESGIHTAADIQRLRAAGYQGFLIGESLMRASDPGQALRRLLGQIEEAHTSGGAGQ